MREIIVDESIISEGMPYPPIFCIDRLKRYKENKKFMDGKYNEGQVIRVRNLKTMGTEVYNVMTSNYYSLIVKKLLALLLVERFEIKYVGGEEEEEKIKEVVDNSDFWEEFSKSYINYLNMGTGALYVRRDRGQVKVNSVNPSAIIKVVEQGNISKVKCYILVQEIIKQDYSKAYKVEEDKYIRVIYDYRGYYKEQVYKVEGKTIKKAVKYNYEGVEIPAEGRVVRTGLRDFSLYVYDNHPLVDEVWGKSEFESIKDIVSKYESIMTIIELVQYKNINPLLQLPRGTMQQNEHTGQLEAVGAGDVVEVSSSDKDIKYITYDLQIKDNLEYARRLQEEIGVQSEMSLPFLTGNYPANLSGEAIKNLMKAPLDKTARTITVIDPILRKMFIEMMFLEGYNLELAKLEIEWKDGIATTEE